MDEISILVKSMPGPDGSPKGFFALPKQADGEYAMADVVFLGMTPKQVGSSLAELLKLETEPAP